MNYGNEAAAMQQDKGYQRSAVLGTGQGIEAGRQPEVTAEMSRLNMAVERLAKISEVLTDRLQPIRRQTGNKLANEGAPTPILCGMAAAIRDRREAIERYAFQLETAMSELEI